MTSLCFDVETGTINKGNPFTASGKLISYAAKIDDGPALFCYYNELDFLTLLREKMRDTTLLIGFNIKFDLHWAARYGIRPPDKCRVWDCQLAEFIITGQKGSYPSLDECCAKIWLRPKR